MRILVILKVTEKFWPVFVWIGWREVVVGGSLLWPIYKPRQAPCATIKGLKQVLQVMERDWSELEAHDNIKANIRPAHTHTYTHWVMCSWDWSEFSPTRQLPIKEELHAHMECIINHWLPSYPCPTLTHHQKAWHNPLDLFILYV